MQWIIATGAPSGVVTMSISGYLLDSGFSSTIMLKMEVPALMLPVPGCTLLVAVMPVPASPSGGQRDSPGRKTPVGSSSRAPTAVRFPAAAPAGSGAGRMSDSFHGWSLVSSPKAASMAGSY